ncbi:magnesium transporter CorA family protein [Paenibacillus sp. NPDC058071]|uniref:magnesium transporter CorA family protein n=1 Tax=Paenibacillus sp. NPDC058071 TaxID=3346326 RepID=UPI0036D96C96
MIHRVLRYPAEWEWHVLQQERLQSEWAGNLPSRKGNSSLLSSPQTVEALEKAIEEAAEEQIRQEQQWDALKRSMPECASWLDACLNRSTSQIVVASSLENGPLVFGTLMYQVSEDQKDIHPFHFWLSSRKLVTLHDDLRITVRLQEETVLSRIEASGSAPEALFVMLAVMLEPFHQGLDGFENRLGDLERAMRHSNRTDLMDTIFERRYELLHWSHLFLPVRELHGAAKEAFMESLIETDGFKRISHRLDRIETLLKHYALEIDTLISMDGAIASFRGNDIMKTLTIFTVMFTPASVLAALWGTNLYPLPWDGKRWGFTILCSIVLAATIVIYIWLWRKGWTGDLLTGRKTKRKREESSSATPAPDEELAVWKGESSLVPANEPIPQRRAKRRKTAGRKRESKH